MARMDAAMAERTFLRWRGLLESQFLNRIKNIVLLDAVSRGLLPDSEYILDGRWCWPAKVSIDYGREASADIALWKAGLKTASQIYADSGEDYEEALRARAKEASIIKDLGQEFGLQPIRISDSVPETVIDSLDTEGAAPLIETIGIGGTQSLMLMIQAMAGGQLTSAQAAVLMKSVFGLDDVAIDAFTKSAAQSATPEPQIPTGFGDENKPTAGMISEAKKGLEWRRKFGRGGTLVGVARARDISNGKNLSDDTVKRMYSFFSRHEVDKQGKGFTPNEEGFPSNGRIAWALWGGDAGQTWARARAEKMREEK
jgi:hypothetical protein